MNGHFVIRPFAHSPIRHIVNALISVNNIQLNYEERGAGEALLLLHGLGSSARDWQLQFDALSPYYRVIAPDMRGHGGSARPRGPYSVPLFAADTAAFMRALNLPPAHVVGLSMGGMIAFQLALDAPELLKSLIIVNSAPELIPRTWAEKKDLLTRLLIAHLMGMKKMGKFLGARLFPEPQQAELRRIFAERWAQNNKRAYLASFHALIGWSVTNRLGEIQCPTLIVAGEMDFFPLAFKQAYTAKIPRANLLVIPASRHATPVDRPEKFNAALKDFLRAVVKL